jgi:hypothetical protein
MGQKKGNQIPTKQEQAYIDIYGTSNDATNRDKGTKPVMIDDNTTLDQVIDIAGMTSGYAKDTDLTDGSINARFDTLTANEYHVTILSSSILYANGSNKFGDSADDRHEFTGTIFANADVLGNFRLNQATASLNAQTGSQNSVNLAISTATGSLNGITNGLMAVTASMKAATIFSGSIQIGATLSNYANDGAAASGGVPVGGLYHTAGAVKVRLT